MPEVKFDRKYLISEPIVAWGSFFILLATYWLTVAPGVSFWDCPEYVSAARLLEVGHPPGNPTWMLVERIVTMLVPARYAALAVNLSSGLLTAFAGFFLAKTIFRVGLWVLLKLPQSRIPAPLAAAGGALTGTLIFGWCDSVWYSAVEAEVYAMSIFMTSLCVWLMTKWAGTSNRGDSWRLLVLIAYLLGLSIGIHQLNLLCIPALAMIWAIRRGIRTIGRLLLIFFLSLVCVVCILMCTMPSTIAIAAEFELLAVNVLNLPALSGVAAYVVLLGVSLLTALAVISKSRNRTLMAITCFVPVLLSGIFVIGGNYIAGALVSAAVSVLLVTGSNFRVRRLYLSMWMLAMILTGYSSYALIPIRGSIPSQANAVMPGEPFAFASYQSREQYGSTPLLYGPTPYSRPMLKEITDAEGNTSYPFYEIDYRHPIYVPKVEGGRLKDGIKGISRADSAENIRLLNRKGDAYLMRGMHGEYVMTPELNMWFPRITGRTPYDISAYGDWVGMDSATMVSVEITDAVDSAGNYVAKKNSEGKRVKGRAMRPSYLQNLQWLLVYQTSYMYWRYFLWNFVGRQNDRPAQGEVQHGNFITGITPVDNAMLGAEDRLPDVAGKANKGRNRYFGLPLLLGLFGIVWLLRARRRGMQTCFVIAVLFIMTGIAITVYLNQGPGEPRERDYSFLGSYLAFSIWTGFGAIAAARLAKSLLGFALPLLVAAWMGFENYDDHDRSGQYAADEFARAVLNSLEPDAIIFVNGDNYTFPLWYAQEVEGIRTDVRVINLSYLSSSVYTANMLADWRDSKRLNTTLKREDIIWDAFRLVTIPAWNCDTVAAVDALKELRAGDKRQFNARYVRIPLSTDSAMVYDLHNLKSSGSYVDFGKLMMFDIVATNAESATPRPVYWLAAIGKEKRIGLASPGTPWIFGRRFGVEDEKTTDSLMLKAALAFRAPNTPGKDVYMDHAPAVQVSAMRGALVSAAKRLLSAGRIEEAAEIAVKADIMMGDGADTYGTLLIEDSTFNTRKELARLLIDCADSLENIAARANPREARFIRARAVEFKARGLYHRRRHEKLMKDWQQYREALPPRLQNKMAPVY